ncbi:hypothetical protein QVD17_26177 [Tagetes erecta]|uniref:Uncharacterized protein n=1 Tax=Tagetes erecta TaxID=13708 RepID=A0AAD8KCC6_TARER|nr:hypothetical protein QVD17_26177 [Tagetes erecta]
MKKSGKKRFCRTNTPPKPNVTVLKSDTKMKVEQKKDKSDDKGFEKTGDGKAVPLTVTKPLPEDEVTKEKNLPSSTIG